MCLLVSRGYVRPRVSILSCFHRLHRLCVSMGSFMLAIGVVSCILCVRAISFCGNLRVSAFIYWRLSLSSSVNSCLCLSLSDYFFIWICLCLWLSHMSSRFFLSPLPLCDSLVLLLSLYIFPHMRFVPPPTFIFLSASPLLPLCASLSSSFPLAFPHMRFVPPPTFIASPSSFLRFGLPSTPLKDFRGAVDALHGDTYNAGVRSAAKVTKYTRTT